MRRFSLTSLASISLLAAGCSAGDPSAAGGKVGTQASAIINGTADTTHQAVVALYDQVNMTECSGTIFKVDVASGTGWMLTASHCVLADPTAMPATPASVAANLLVIQGDDINAANAVVYQVTDYVTHPKANPFGNVNTGAQTGGPFHDLAVVQFGGASAATPTIPLLTADLDMLTAGTSFMSVGYGETQNTTTNNNSLRYNFTDTFANAKLNGQTFPGVGTYTVAAKETTSATCHGDSGGPWLVTIAGTEYVSATLYGGDCMSVQVGPRVSEEYVGFIGPYVDKGPLTLTCAQCESTTTEGMGACSASVATCAANTDCNALLQNCMCAANDQTCSDTCFTNHPAGRDLYLTILDCICFDGCSTTCATDAVCTGAKCGFSTTDATCESCIETSCCSQDSACYADKACHECLDKDTPDPSCASNALLQAFVTCRDTTCGAGICTPAGSGGAGGTGGAGGSGTAGTGGADTTGQGGADTQGAGGANGGASAQGGAEAQGGADAQGGSSATAGSTASGGVSAQGGAATAGTGGSSALGGSAPHAGAAGIGTAGTSSAAGNGGKSSGNGGATASAGKGGGLASAGTSSTATGGSVTASTGTGGEGGDGTGNGDTSSDGSSNSSGGCSVPSSNSPRNGAIVLMAFAAMSRLRRRRTLG